MQTTINNSEKYHFKDFTRDNYRSLLRLAKQNYQFVTYDNLPQDENFIVWRHDLDFSPHAARKIAQLEAEEGIVTTYFLLLHSEFYNLFEAKILQCIKDISAFGHRIGLHFDPHYYDIHNEANLEKWLLFEKKIIEQVFAQEIKVFSFHITNAFTMSCLNWKYANMINVYSDFFQNKIGYCSDSNGIWRFDRLQTILQEKKYKSLQVLTHPEYWQDQIMSPVQRIKRCIDGRAINTLKNYERFLSENNRPHIDW